MSVLALWPDFHPGPDRLSHFLERKTVRQKRADWLPSGGGLPSRSEVTTFLNNPVQIWEESCFYPWHLKSICVCGFSCCFHCRRRQGIGVRLCALLASQDRQHSHPRAWASAGSCIGGSRAPDPPCLFSGFCAGPPLGRARVSFGASRAPESFVQGLLGRNSLHKAAPSVLPSHPPADPPACLWGSGICFSICSPHAHAMGW